jgi:hypothetical protein
MGNVICAVVLLAIAGCGDGSLVDAETNVDPQLTDSLNPEVNPVVDLSVPVSILGANAS